MATPTPSDRRQLPAASPGFTAGIRNVRALQAFSVGAGAVPVQESGPAAGGAQRQGERPRRSESEGANWAIGLSEAVCHRHLYLRTGDA